MIPLRLPIVFPSSLWCLLCRMSALQVTTIAVRTFPRRLALPKPRTQMRSETPSAAVTLFIAPSFQQKEARRLSLRSRQQAISYEDDRLRSWEGSDSTGHLQIQYTRSESGSGSPN